MASAARLDIRSAHDIVRVLASGDLPTRLALCQAAAAHPAHILAYGAAAGVDLVQAFLSAARRRETLAYRKATLAVVVHFDDPRVVELFREVLQTSSESDILRLAAKRVALDTTAESRRFLRERLLHEQSPLRVRCIAAALAGAAELSDAEKLRLVLAGTGEPDPHQGWPRNGEACALGWASELRGPFALRARRLLEGAANQLDFLALLGAWPSWGDGDRAWFVSWGSALYGSSEPPRAVCGLLSEALSQPARGVLLAALRWCSAHPSAVPVAALQRHAASSDPELRLAAVSALPRAASEWSLVARSDADAAVRALAVERALSGSDVASSAAELAGLIEDEDWRVRAALVRGLHQAGATAVSAARNWLSHASPRVRAGALQVLLDHGQERWLVEALIG